MKLTGKCKEDFEKWGTDNSTGIYLNDNNILICKEFYDLPESMQYGVYVDFFDSVYINIEIHIGVQGQLWVYVGGKNACEIFDRQKARIKSIEKAN